MFEPSTSIFVVFWLFFCVCMAAISVYDIRYRVIRGRFLCALVALWLLYVGMVCCTKGAHAAGVFVLQGVVASVITLVSLCAATIVYERVRQKDSLGGGDIKLLAVLALYLGIEQTVICLLVACVLMVVITIFRRLIHRIRTCALTSKTLASISCTHMKCARDTGTFAFAPALCTSAVVLLLCGG